ncbi:MAG: Ig-like domain-containing protein [Gemmatimonadales bacterium]
MGARDRVPAVAMALFMAACGGGDPISPQGLPAPAVATSVELNNTAVTLLPADSVLITAVVRDQYGAPMAGQAVTWSISDGTVASVDGGAVKALATGTATITAMTGAASAISAVTVQADDRTAYLWANDPSSASYSPSATYEHLSSGGHATITRSGVGSYSVSLPGLGATGAQRTNVQISASGTGPAFCKSAGWTSAGADLTVQVRCFEAGGAPADTRFTLLALGGTALGGRYGALLATDPAAAAPYQPVDARSSRGDSVIVIRTAPGDYLVRMPGLKRAGADGPEQVLVTAVGEGTQRCWVRGWTPDRFEVNVGCGDATGQSADSRFSLVVLDQGRPGRNMAFAWANDPEAAAPYAPDANYSYNSANLANEITRNGVGSYSVIFSGMTRTTGAAETFIVSAHSNGALACRIGSWGNTISVSIFCYDSAGALADASFDLVMIQ